MDHPPIPPPTPEQFYIVERTTPGNDKIYTVIVAGPFDTEDEAVNVRQENYHNIEALDVWYDVWSYTWLRKEGYLS